MQLVITVAGEDRPDLIEELTRTVKDCKCAILESRMTEVGALFAAHLLVDGNWNHIVKLENALEALGSRYRLKVATLRASENRQEEENLVPYGVDIFASDQIDNIHELTAFFTTRGIKILDLSTSRYPAPYTNTPLFLARMIVKIPVATRIVSLRDEFLEFCDHQNLDAILEPVKR
ncbi:MAG: glycine cleavage system transcriptional repressor [Methylococcaceae bacterium]|nr:glycine cleavage system transcriptional repressor [Methylococcaceae bacterium]